jgi:4-cresol dehydrogenase (hydroxylating)
VSLVYDRDIQGEDLKALACHDEMFEALTNEGYFPYRLSSHAHKAFSKIDSSLSLVLRSLKQHMDPESSLSPKKYNI